MLKRDSINILEALPGKLPSILYIFAPYNKGTQHTNGLFTLELISSLISSAI